MGLKGKRSRRPSQRSAPARSKGDRFAGKRFLSAGPASPVGEESSIDDAITAPVPAGESVVWKLPCAFCGAISHEGVEPEGGHRWDCPFWEATESVPF